MLHPPQTSHKGLKKGNWERRGGVNFCENKCLLHPPETSCPKLTRETPATRCGDRWWLAESKARAELGSG